jgi:hypothetical protein
LKLGSTGCGPSCSDWFNRDLPGGIGDYEVTDATTNPAKPCPGNYYVQALLVGTTLIFNSAQEVLTKTGNIVNFVVNASSALGVGMYCENGVSNNQCKNFEARFCCGL